VAAQAPMSQVLSVVNASIGTFVPSVLQTVTGLVDTILGSLPFAGGTPATSGGPSGLGGLLDGIVGGGTQSLPGNFGGILDDLLGGLFGGGSAGGSTPAVGVGGILNSVTGMIGNLLGGLFGGQAAPAS